MHLIEAYLQLDIGSKSLIFVGDGDLRHLMEVQVDQSGDDSVLFLGFQNREQITKYYAISDLLVLPSVRETWGIVVNEAMCFGLPVIVSDQVGAGADLISEGQNGYRVPTTGDALFRSIKQIADLSEAERLLMGMRSFDIVKAWSNRNLAELLIDHIGFIKTR